MTYDASTIWLIIAVMAVGTYLIRLSFLGIIGDRKLPGWILRLLRFTPVAFIPGLAAPLIAQPGGPADIPMICAAVATLATGWLSRSLLAAVIAGAGVYYLVGYLGSVS